MSQEEGSVSKEKQEEFEKDRKRVIEKMVGQSYIPNRKPNERISVKEFSQEGEKEMVVFDEIRLDQGPTPRSIERCLSIKDFYNTYVTHTKKARLDESYGKSDDKNNVDQKLIDELFEDEIVRLKKERKTLEKPDISFEGMGEKIKELSRIKDEIEKLERQREVVIGKSVGTRAEFEKKVKQLDVITQEIADLKSRNVKGEGSAEKGSVESTTENGVTFKESIEKIKSLDDLITFIEGNEDGVQQYIKQEKENKPSVEALKRLRDILADDSLSIDQKTSKCAEELRKETSFPKITNEIGLFGKTKELVQNILREERGDLKSDEKIDVQTLENDEKVEKISKFETVKKEIQEVESFEEMYAILEKYKNNISGDVDTEMSYSDILEQIGNACENFESSVKNNLIDKNHFVVPQTLPNEVFFKDEKITLSHTFWRNIFTKELEKRQKEVVDQENAPHPEEGGKLIENKESLEKLTLEQGIQNAQSLEELREMLVNHKEANIPDGGNIFDTSITNIAKVIDDLIDRIDTQGERETSRPSENYLYTETAFKYFPETYSLQETVKKLADKMWDEKYTQTPKDTEKSQLEEGIQNAQSLEELMRILDSYQGEIVDGEEAYSKEDIVGKINALSISIAMQGPDASKPSENEQYQSDFFDHVPQTLQETVKKLADKEWEEKYPNAGESVEGEKRMEENEEEQKEKSELEQGIQNVQSLYELLDFIEKNGEKLQFYIKKEDPSKEDSYVNDCLEEINGLKSLASSLDRREVFLNDKIYYSITRQFKLKEVVRKLVIQEWEEIHLNTEKKDGDGEKLEPQEVQGDHEEIKPGHKLIQTSSAEEVIAKERKDEEGDFLRELTKELDDARREYAQDIYNGEKKKRYNDVLVRYNIEVSSRFREFIKAKEFEQLVRANEVQEQLAIKDIRAEYLIEKAPLWEKGKALLQGRIDEWKKMSLKKKLLVSISIAGVGGIGLATGATVLGAGALVAGTAVRFVSAAATTTGFKGILESYAEKLYEGADRERMEQIRSLFWENKYGSDSPEQRGDNVTRLLVQSAEKQADRARKRRLDRHARTAVALAGSFTLAMASRCLGQTAVDALGGYFGGPLEGSGGVTEPQGKIEIGMEKEPIAYDKDYIFPDNPPQEYVPEIKTIEVPIERTPEEYIQAHPEMFREISERKWMDNNTSLQVGANGRITGADLNELNLRWGGGGDGIDANGNYVFDVAKMTPDGSFHKDLSVDARDVIQKGQLKMLFTLDGDTQSYGIEIPVRPDGSVVIDSQSPEGKLLFQTVGEGTDTKLEFKGKFAEVGVMGEDGKFTVLATHTGEGLESVSDVIKKEITVPQIDQEIPPVELDAEPVGGGGKTTSISEDAIIEDRQQEITPSITTEPTVSEEPVVPLGKEPSLEKVIIGPGKVAVLGLAGMGARKIHKARGGVNQSMIPAPVRRPEMTPSSAPLETEGEKDGEKIVNSLRDYKEYEKGLSLGYKRQIEKTAKTLQGMANKTEEELKVMPAQQFSNLPVGEKIKNIIASSVAIQVGGENEDVQKLIREEMINPKEGENTYEYIRRIIIQRMILTKEYK